MNLILSKMKIEPILDEEFWVYVAPAGELQLATLTPSRIMTVAFARLMYTFGVGLSPHAMKQKGFTVQKVKVTIVAAEKEATEIN